MAYRQRSMPASPDCIRSATLLHTWKHFRYHTCAGALILRVIAFPMQPLPRHAVEAPSSAATSLRQQLDGLRTQLRANDLWFIGLAALVGLIAAALMVLQAGIAHGLKSWLYSLAPEERLSTATSMTPTQLLVLPLGGLLVGLVTLMARRRKRALVDAVEANALHGGRMSMRDNLIVAVQTLLSNCFGASVGLEATYTQMGSGAGSQLGRVLRVRRSDMRTLVGAGAAGAIAGAFGAPLAGAFYALEIVIGAYTPSALAPVAAAALAGAFMANALGAAPYSLPAAVAYQLQPRDYAIYIALGLACALIGIAVMRLVAGIECSVGRINLPVWGRPAIGGLLLIPLAMYSPQVLSSGHGALHLDLTSSTFQVLAILLVLKCIASGISLGFGFRGGPIFRFVVHGVAGGQPFRGEPQPVAGRCGGGHHQCIAGGHGRAGGGHFRRADDHGHADT